uniref:G protein-coupled receptor n=1 Tax=Acrobeloides nanus TaxID=290746 RepID=A0A914EEY6_9BILA
MKTPEEWYAYGTKNLPLGFFYIASGIVYESFYIPVLTVMLQKEFFQHSSYKIMFVMGVIDAITLIEICFFNGYDTIIGDVFCTAPTRVYLVSLVSTFLCIGWAIKYSQFNTTAVSLSQRLINIQAFMISMEIAGTGVMCIYFQNFYVPDFLYVVSHILWQMSHGKSHNSI